VLQVAQQRYDAVVKGAPERLVSGSDDHTMFLWTPATSKSHIARMTGHVQLINQVRVIRQQSLMANTYPSWSALPNGVRETVVYIRHVLLNIQARAVSSEVWCLFGRLLYCCSDYDFWWC
jgi:hypothetical protein